MSNRVAFAAGFALATAFYLFPACGGGGGGDAISQSTPPSPDTADHYLAPLFPRPSHGIVTRLDGAPYTEWIAGSGHISWGQSGGAEILSFRNCAGADYAFLDQLDALVLVGVINRVDGVTLNCSASSVYLPKTLPGAGKVRVQSWFYLVGPDGARTPGYYESEDTFGDSMTNLCWQGSGPQRRLVDKHEEAWWNEGGGWGVGSSPVVAGTLPWVDDKPVEIAVNLGRTVYIGRDAGPYWSGVNEGAALCLRSS